MRKLVVAAVLVMLVAFGFATSARADTILFTGPAYSGLNGLVTGNVNGMTFTASPTGATLTQNSEGIGVNGPCAWGSPLAGCFDDGGEVGYTEKLSIVFATPTLLNGFNVMQLFPIAEEWPGEYGLYRINNGLEASFGSGNASGNLAVSFAPTLVTQFDFYTSNNLLLRGSDYSVAGISTVPEPSSMLLLGCGLIGLAGAVSRRTKK